MFAKTIIDSDAFLDMPSSSQSLYFHLSMRADDEGFINNPKKIQRMVSGSDDDMRILIARKFVIAFESGIIAIKHWKIHNYIRNDRFKPTMYQDEMSLLRLNDNKTYSLDTVGIPCDSQVTHQMDTQVRLGKVRLGKVRLGEGEHDNLSADQYNSLVNDYGNEITEQYIAKVKSYCEEKRNGKPYKNTDAVIRKWIAEDKPEVPKKSSFDIDEISEFQKNFLINQKGKEEKE